MIYVKAFFGGIVAVLIALYVSIFGDVPRGVGVDPVSYFRHFDLVPSWWLKGLGIFAVGFVLVILLSRLRRRGSQAG